MSTQYCLVLLSLVSVSLLATTDALVGGWNPIKNLGDPEVIEIAKFAVTEYDKKSGAKLEFEKVVSGESQVVAGINYRLVVAAKDGAVTKNYQAVVWEKVENTKVLTSFNPVQ